MRKAILFDLDDTLLEVVSWEAFSPVLEETWKKYFSPAASAEDIRLAIEAVIEAMDVNDGSTFTNEEVMLKTMRQSLGIEVSFLQFERYWSEVLGRLKTNWRSLPDARHVVVTAFEQNMQVVIATGMQIPMTAIELKLEWAGIPVTEFDYAFISAIENMHASKPHLSYYYEVLETIERRPEECIMVGDSWDQDIVPAVKVGIPSYWVAHPAEEVPDADLPLLGRGNLSDLVIWLQGRKNT